MNKEKTDKDVFPPISSTCSDATLVAPLRPLVQNIENMGRGRITNTVRINGELYSLILERVENDARK